LALNHVLGLLKCSIFYTLNFLSNLLSAITGNVWILRAGM